MIRKEYAIYFSNISHYNNMKEKNKIIVVAIIIFVILIMIMTEIIKYLNSYSVVDNTIKLEENICIKTNFSVNIKNEKELNNNKYVIFIGNNSIGDAIFSKGINGKYKIGSVGYGNKLISYRIIKANKAKYFVVGGKNTNMKIKYILLLLDNEKYKIQVPREEYFIVYCRIPLKTRILNPDISNIKIYNESNADITNEVLAEDFVK